MYPFEPQKILPEKLKQEYGIFCQRLYPQAQIPTPFGATWCVIEPSGSSTPHDHDEEETFMILEGKGELLLGDEKRLVQSKDVIYIPAFTRHEIKNLSSDENLVFLSLWWRNKEDESGPEHNPH